MAFFLVLDRCQPHGRHHLRAQSSHHFNSYTRRRMLCLRSERCAFRGSSLRAALAACHHKRSLLTLAIETSCDDTSVAVLEKHERSAGQAMGATLHFHEKITANNSQFRGIHPVASLESHQLNLAGLVQKALLHLPSAQRSDDPLHTIVVQSAEGASYRQRPTFVCATRGPGMRSSLSVGLDTAKGLAVGWGVPFVGVHHMQAHTLTPRLASAIRYPSAVKRQPNFPFLTLLVSGGHTMLLHSQSLTSHVEMATTSDIAVGDCIDKMARAILPPNLLSSVEDTNYGRLLESFAFPKAAFPSSASYNYTAPRRRHEELNRETTKWGWAISPPLAGSKAGPKANSLEFSFSGLDSSVRRVVESGNTVSSKTAPPVSRLFGQPPGVAERVDLAREAMRRAFEHIAGRVVMALQVLQDRHAQPDCVAGGVQTLVVSGGVAANRFLRTVLRSFLDARGFGHVALEFPPIELCTDNAAMIAWAGLEMWEAGWETETRCLPLKKWPMGQTDEPTPSRDAEASDPPASILAAPGWKRRRI